MKGARTASSHNLADVLIFSSFSQRKSLTETKTATSVVRHSAPTAATFAKIDSSRSMMLSRPDIKYVAGMNCVTVVSHFGNMLNGKDAPLRNNIERYSTCVRMALSCIEFTTDATVRPTARNATNPNDANKSTEMMLRGNTIP